MSAPRILPSALVLVTLLLGTHPSAYAQSDAKWDPRHLKTPPLRRIEVPEITRVPLPNGMTVLLLENHDLPRVSGRLFVRTTPLWISDAKVGLGSITGEVIRSGGTATHGGDWLDDHLAAIGATIATDFSIDLATADFDCLSENLDEVVGLFADVIRHPAFPPDKIELSKVGLRQAIASRNDEVVPLLVRVAYQAVYGKNSPFARQPEYATVAAVTREDCLQLHRTAFEPSRAVLAITGDFRSDHVKERLQALLGDWKGPGVALPPAAALAASGPARLVFAPKDDVTQSGILLTQLGFRADDPDYPAMDVYQMALGGGFQSRLVRHIRTARGLAYSTGASAGEGYARPGVFLAYSLTRGDSTMTALGLLRDEVRASTAAPFTPGELDAAKQSVQNAFVFNFERRSSVLFRAAYYQALGYPQDFLERYQKGLEAVTAASTLEAARRKVHPDGLIAVVVGKEKDFDRPLESYGLPVERVDITIPPPPAPRKPRTVTHR